MRVALTGLPPGRSMRGRDCEIDGQVSHAREGITAGKRWLGLSAQLWHSDPSPHSWQDVVSAALAVIPEDSGLHGPSGGEWPSERAAETFGSLPHSTTELPACIITGATWLLKL